MKKFQKLAKSLWRQEAAAASERLALLKPEQKPAFDLLKVKFASHYDGFKNQDITEFLMPLWAEVNAELEKALLPIPSFSFIREPYIKYTMLTCMNGKELRTTMNRLTDSISQKMLRKFLLEDFVGHPFLFATPYLSSHNALSHLRHLVEFSRATGCDTQKIKNVVEWGGGYGTMAKIFKRQSLVAGTYTIIDSPIFSCLQWLYLGTIFGEKNVHLLKHPADPIKTHKINLLPLCLLKGRKLQADLFLSTLALCESSTYSQDYVRGQNWFRAKRILLSYQTNNRRVPSAERVGQMARAAGARIIPFGKKISYAFR